MEGTGKQKGHLQIDDKVHWQIFGWKILRQTNIRNMISEASQCFYFIECRIPMTERLENISRKF